MTVVGGEAISVSPGCNDQATLAVRANISRASMAMACEQRLAYWYSQPILPGLANQNWSSLESPLEFDIYSTSRLGFKARQMISECILFCITRGAARSLAAHLHISHRMAKKTHLFI
jgi:hypothetical protein